MLKTAGGVDLPCKAAELFKAADHHTMHHSHSEIP